MLLASISSSSSDQGGPRPPRLAVRLPGPLSDLKNAVQRRGNPSPGGTSPRGRHPRHHVLPRPDLGAAGAQLQRAAAVAGGVLVAAISQAAQRLASARPGRGSQTLPFYQSFKLPWNAGARSGSRRWAAAGRRWEALGSSGTGWHAHNSNGAWRQQASWRWASLHTLLPSRPCHALTGMLSACRAPHSVCPLAGPRARRPHWPRRCRREATSTSARWMCAPRCR